MKNKIVEFVNLGCSKNLVDSEKLSAQLERVGYRCRHDSDNIMGDIVVINTCGFIGDAKEESINTILEFCELKKKKKISKLYVMGCLSGRYFDELPGEIPDVDRYFGKFNYQDLLTELGETYDELICSERTITTPSHYAYLKISEGCNRHCAYCAIPIITGNHKSRPIEEIVEEVKWLVSKGVKEFQVIAQDLSFYGLDLYKELKLPELIERISDVEGVEWIRLHYAYPSQFPWDVLRVMRERKNVCKYLDVALQHISDNVLTRMHRHITKAETLEFLARVRKEVPGIHIRTTLLVGFPGETDEDFEELVQFAKTQKFERMGAFPYSEEEGTYSANNYKDDVPEEVKQERVDRLMKVQQRIAFENSYSKKDSTLKVIIDREEPDYFIGRTEFDSPEVDQEVLIKKDKDLKIGEFYDVYITDAEEFELFGEVR